VLVALVAPAAAALTAALPARAEGGPPAVLLEKDLKEGASPRLSSRRCRAAALCPLHGCAVERRLTRTRAFRRLAACLAARSCERNARDALGATRS
jgi:hypothetical protein